MKRIFILVATSLLLTGVTFAKEATLIDFTKLVADVTPVDNVMTQNQATVMDFGADSENSYTPKQKEVMKTSLAIRNWDVVLASSSRSVENQGNSYTREAKTKKDSVTVLGVRVHFPVESFNSWARIQPPFEIPAFEEKAQAAGTAPAADAEATRFENGFGVVKNVGTLKSITVRFYGLNFPHGLSVILIDSDGNESVHFMGYMRRDEWGELTWTNPAYVTEVRNRELRLFSVYPKSEPFVKFGGFIIHRDASMEGGDYIGYFRDVKIVYDEAVLKGQDYQRDINDEDVWGIIGTRESSKKTAEMKRFGDQQLLRFLEAERQDKPAAKTTEQPK